MTVRVHCMKHGHRIYFQQFWANCSCLEERSFAMTRLGQ